MDIYIYFKYIKNIYIYFKYIKSMIVPINENNVNNKDNDFIRQEKIRLSN